MKRKTTPVTKVIGQNLKSLRQIRQLSQIDLAEILGVTFQQVQKYERGINRLPVDKLHRAKEHLNIPYEFFFQGIGFKNIEREINKEVGQLSSQKTLLDILSVIQMFKTQERTPNVEQGK